MKYIALLTLVVLGLLTSCGIPKEILSKIEKDKRVMVDLPVDYYNLFPRLEYDKWDKDYNIYNKFLTKNIMSTQSWMAYSRDEVEIASCPNSVRTHVQLDTLSMITDKKLVIGEWRITANRRIVFTDSAVYSNKQIYRKSKTIYDEKDADVFLVHNGK